MSATATGLRKQVLADDPLVMTIDDVLQPGEAEHIIGLAADRLDRAKVSMDADYAVIEGRSGSNCWLRYDDDAVVKRIGERIAALVDMPLEHAEAMQVIHYGETQEYRPHFDAYDLGTAKGQRCCRFGGQRLVTALVYLNRADEGGGTGFPELGLTVDAEPGRMVVFHNTAAEDRTVPHPGSLHAGLPVTRGEKWAFNLWFHARPMKEVQHFAAPPSSDASESSQPPVQIRVNRARQLFDTAFNNLRDELLQLTPPVCLTYWDTYGNSQPDLTDLSPDTRLITLMDRSVSNVVANKRDLGRLIRQHGLEHLAPPTFETVSDALSAKLDPTVWFVKPVHGTAGKGMYCLSNKALAGHQLPEHHVLQAGVTDLALDEGRKFTARVYVFIWNGELYLFNTGFTMTHGLPYDPASTDYAVQIDHRGYEKADSAVTVRPGHCHPQFVAAFPALRQLIRDLCPALAGCIAASDKDHYLLLGVDTLICADGRVQLIEINNVPNFIHTAEVNREVNVPFFEAVMQQLLGQEDQRLECLVGKSDK